ncbi:MAG: histidine phosphatase family protein [Leptolyngbyaceae cyanobacterium RU_5_1]|nr:histidine phosphatase family protein [Leptolyngbyaceae cyanobacterium RU_5_1]
MPPLTTPDWKTSPSNTRVILMRHGQSTYNAEKRHQGSSDNSVLTAKGRMTAYQTGLLLREFNINTLYLSPLQRTQETAHEILAAIATETDQLPTMIADPALKEISLPLWEGLPYQVVRDHFAEDYRCWKERPHEFQMRVDSDPNLPRTGSLTLTSLTKYHYPVLELYDRVRQFWQEILPHHVGKTLLIVSHAGTNRALISTALGMSPNQFHTLQQSNCGISILQFPTAWNQPAHLDVINSTDHLGDVLPKLKEGKQGLRLLIVPSNGTDPNRIRALANRLESIKIDFSLSNDLDCSQPTVNQLLQSHSNAVQLQVLREDFPQAWQQMLMSRRTQPPTVEASENQLLTALVVVREAIALRMLSQLLDVQPQHLHLIPDTLSVIHYPQTLNTPVLQAMNVG